MSSLLSGPMSSLPCVAVEVPSRPDDSRRNEARAHPVWIEVNHLAARPGTSLPEEPRERRQVWLAESSHLRCQVFGIGVSPGRSRLQHAT
jgi:hypothetical protein